MSSNTDNTKIWIRVETFVYGAIPIPPHPRLSLHNILKIIPYAKSRKGGYCYPNMPYSIWRNIALYKLQLPEDLAWMYFATFDTIDDSITAEDRIALDEKLAACKNTKELERVRESTSVPLLKFTLFLFLQHFYKISVRESLAYVEWPSDSSKTSSSTTQQQQQNPHEKSFNEQTYISFVRKKLGDLLNLLAEPAANQQDFYLTMESVEALNIVFMGSVDNMRTEKPLHGTVFAHAARLSAPNSKLYEARALEAWLLDHLTTSPFGVSACIRTGRQLAWNQTASTSSSSSSSPPETQTHRQGRVVTNAASVPGNSAAGNKIVIVSHVGRRWVSRASSATLDDASVKIHRCHYATVYLLAPLRSVSIEKCRHTEVVLGAVETTLHLVGCERVTVTAACRRFTASRNVACAAYLLTPNRPLVLAGNDRLRLAPYNVVAAYPAFEQHLYDAGLTAQCRNLWDRPHYLWSSSASSVSLLPPDDWYPLSMPFAGYAPTPTPAAGGGVVAVPEDYEVAVRRRRDVSKVMRDKLASAQLTPEQRAAVTRVIDDEFVAWLKEKRLIHRVQELAVPGE